MTARILTADEVRETRQYPNRTLGFGPVRLLDALCESHEALRAEVERLREALIDYGEHEIMCKVWVDQERQQYRMLDDAPCDCGLAKAKR